MWAKQFEKIMHATNFREMDLFQVARRQSELEDVTRSSDPISTDPYFFCSHIACVCRTDFLQTVYRARIENILKKIGNRWRTEVEEYRVLAKEVEYPSDLEAQAVTNDVGIGLIYGTNRSVDDTFPLLQLLSANSCLRKVKECMALVGWMPQVMTLYQSCSSDRF